MGNKALRLFGRQDWTFYASAAEGNMFSTCPSVCACVRVRRRHSSDRLAVDSYFIHVHARIFCFKDQQLKRLNELQTLWNHFWISRCLHVRFFPADVCRWRPYRWVGLTRSNPFKLLVNYCRTNTRKHFLANVL